MDELVAQVQAATGASAEVARKAVAIILRFLVRESRSDKVGPFVESLPGARELIGDARGASGGLMGVFGELTGAGLGMGQVQSAAKAVLNFSRQKAGAAATDEVVRSIPGLSTFI
jgi:hypothetical protein